MVGARDPPTIWTTVLINTTALTAIAGDSAIYGCRILLAEDSAPARAFYKELLGRAGADVVAVADGGAALRAFQKGVTEEAPFDVVNVQFQRLGAMQRVELRPAAREAQR